MITHQLIVMRYRKKSLNRLKILRSIIRNMHQLTKTDFIQYLNCPESLWLLKNKPEDFPKGEFSLFL